MSISVVIAYHSGYGHTARQARAVASGAASVSGVTAALHDVSALDQCGEDQLGLLVEGRGEALLDGDLLVAQFDRQVNQQASVDPARFPPPLQLCREEPVDEALKALQSRFRSGE